MTVQPETRSRSRTVVILSIILILAVLCAAVASLLVGSRSIGLQDNFAALIGHGESDIRHIVWNLRVPRTALAFAAGASLAVAGALAQAWTRNPLADPGFIGVTAGASFAVATGSLIGLTTLAERGFLALVGAAAASLLVVAVSYRSSKPLTLILVGVGVSTALQASVTLMSLYNSEVLDAMRRWTVGSTFGRDYSDLALAAFGLFIGLLLAAVAARPLDLLSMGDEMSTSLGGSPRTARTLAAVSVVVLAGTATAAVGPVVFVGFAAPHLIRHVVGPQLRNVIVPSALLGGLIVLVSDIVGRLVVRPGELEMSIVAGFSGAPILIIAVQSGAGWRKDGL